MSYLGKPPKSMPIKERRDLVNKLKEIRRDATMESSNIPQEIKDTIQLYQRTWVIEPLDELINRYETKD